MISRWKVVTGATAVVAVLACAGLAGAHAQRLKFTPDANTVVVSAPNELTLAFTQKLTGIKVEAFDVNGHAVTDGHAVIDSADAATVKVPLKNGLAVGSYTVKWEAGSADGHTSTGRYQFHIAAPSDAKSVRIFIDGQEIKSDVAPQIVNGRTMLPLRAMAEALGKTVEWDEADQFVRVFDSPAGHAHHETYVHPAGTEAPTVKLHVTPDKKSGFNIKVETTNWTWAPDNVNGEAAPNEGHGHLYVDGVKVARLYGPYYHLDGLEPGQHDIKVTLNANNHADYAVDDHHKLEASVSVVKGAAGSSVQESGGDHGHGSGHHH